jgi:ubiquinone/menaquinone biosynthesis C-methylase UbiE/uncharacterized protein YbaR (Trm112 family)
MEKFNHLEKIKYLYSKGINIIQYLRSLSGEQINSIEDILISYDFQSGSYIKEFYENENFYLEYTKPLASFLNSLKNIDSILEVGVGEATTLYSLITNLTNSNKNFYGFDLSWSRIKYAREFLKATKSPYVNLFTANLFEIPLKDNSIDIVYTSHSIEPNGGSEEKALTELYRIAKKYLILIEPAYDFASAEAKERMIRHGYVTNLFQTAKQLNYNILEYRLYDYSANPLNPTGIMIIEKSANDFYDPILVCPVSKTKLIRFNETLLYSQNSFLAFPIVDGIPCLLRENSILTSHLLSKFNELKIDK